MGRIFFLGIDTTFPKGKKISSHIQLLAAKCIVIFILEEFGKDLVISITHF
jgi:hypothetical protein